MIHFVTEAEVQQVRDLIIATCQYTPRSASGAAALRTVNRLWENLNPAAAMGLPSPVRLPKDERA